MNLRYRVTRAKAPLFNLSDPPTPGVIAANAEAIAEWLKGIHQRRVEVARMGGLATKGISTSRKRQSSAENGKKGGRPRKRETMEQRTKVAESRARRAAQKVGLRATKSRRAESIDNMGGFMLTNPDDHCVVAGARYELNADEVIEWCKG